MNIVYFSHGYRKEENSLVQFFGELIQSQGLVLSIDPPSKNINAAKLERHFNSTDGMIAVLNRREGGDSKHIPFEISLCLRARKPLLVFLEDIVDAKGIPSRVLQKRFSRGYLPREINEHKHAIQSFKTYMGVMPLPKYQPSNKKRACLLIGLSVLHENERKAVIEIIKKRSYSILQVNETTDHIFQKQTVYETICLASLAICFVDSKSYVSNYYLGVIRTAILPTILLTTNPSYNYEPNIPEEYQPRIIETENMIFSLEETINTEIDSFEENVVDIEDKKRLKSYTDRLLEVSSSEGNYDKDTHNSFINLLIGDNNYLMNGGQAGNIGPNGHVHGSSFNQIWNETKNDVDLNELAEDLKRLLPKLNAEAKTTENYASLGNIAEAELSARNGDGPKTYEYLQKAGKWALDIACQIAVPVATDALKILVGI